MQVVRRGAAALGAGYTLYAVFQLCSLAEAVTYSKSAQLPSIRLSQSELLSTVQRARAFVDSANGRIDQTRRLETFELEGGPAKVTLEGRFGASELAGAPEFSQRVYYSYRLADAPISRIAVRLSDYSREVTVEGTSREQVDALMSLLSEDLRAKTLWFGGTNHRLAGGLVLMVGGLALLATANRLRNGRMQIAFQISGPLLVLSTSVLPWSEWLPGTAVYPGEASWLVRNSPLLTLVGVVLTILTFVLSLIYSARLARSSVRPAGTRGGAKGSSRTRTSE